MSTGPSDNDPSVPTASEASAGRLNTRIALLMLCAVALPCLVLDALANEPHVLEGTRQACWSQSIWKRQIPIFCFYDHFVDSTDRLMHQDIPDLDFSRGGGVCMFGASNATWALPIWQLPGESRPFVHNFSMGGTNHGDHFEMVRYLVEKEGMFKAGAEKTLCVFAVSYHMTHNAKLPGDGPHVSFQKAWTRRGFYEIGADGAYQPTRLNATWKRIIVERAKITGILKELINLVYTPIKPAQVPDPEKCRQEWTATLGPRWKEKMERDLEQFAQTIEYVRNRGAKVLVINMPGWSWDEKLPFEGFYTTELRKICSQAGVEYVDLRHTIPEADFADSVHLTPSGIEKFKDAVQGRFLDHLRTAGLLTSGEPAALPRTGRSKASDRAEDKPK